MLYFVYFTLLTLLFGAFNALGNNAKFMHISNLDGLSNNDVKAICKDSRGFLWFGTQNGLNKYDGYKCTVYKRNSSSQFAIIDDNINAIAEDNDGNLWIGTDEGLCKFIYHNEMFLNYEKKDTLNFAKVDHRIVKLFIDNAQILWVCYDNYIKHINLKTGKRIEIFTDPILKKHFTGKTVSCIYEDKKNNLWIGLWYEGLVKISANKKKYTFFKQNLDKAYSLPDNIIHTIIEDSNNKFWLGSCSMGYFIYNQNNNTFNYTPNSNNKNEIVGIIEADTNKIWICFRHSITEINASNLNIINTYKNNPFDINSLTPGRISTVYKDNDDIVWIGTGEGITYSNPKGNKFSQWLYKIGKQPDSEKNYVTGICTYKNSNNIWISTFGGGLYCYNFITNTIEHFNNNNNKLISDFINCIYFANTGLLWVGTTEGISIFDPVKKITTKSLTHSETNVNSLHHNFVRKIIQDNKNNYWIITLESLDLIENNEFIHFTRSKLNGLSSNKINDICQDKLGYIWIATNNGLNKYNWDKRSNKQYYYNSKIKESISSSDVYTVFEDINKNLWIGTRSGLNKYNYNTNTFSSGNEKGNYPSEIVYKIQNDWNNNLWLVTSNGLSKFNTKTNIEVKYDENEGLKINKQAFYTDTVGNFYIGHRHEGFYKFNPQNIVENTKIPSIYITDFLLFNKPVPVEPYNKNAILQQTISETNEIILSHNQSVISFEFTALNYFLSQKNKFAYKLVGFDKQWTYVLSNKRFITYTNLYPGNYTLLIKGSNNDGLWNEKGVSLKIKILPPFWLTNYAYIIYFISLFTLLFTIQNLILKKYRLKTKTEIARAQAQHLHEIDQLKLNFFANVSHEFRTPLTLILGPLTRLLQKKIDNPELAQQLILIQRNANRLSELTNQLLDLQKLDANKMIPEICYGSITDFIKNVVGKFEYLSISKNIQYNLIASNSIIEGWFDQDKTEKIISNLISNAFKFTNTKIEIRVWEANNTVIVEIEDNGKGISAEQQKVIFDKFHQADNSITRVKEGTGIGLSIVDEMVKLLNGSIIVNSILQQGSCFTVQLPINKEAFKSFTEINYDNSFSANNQNFIQNNITTNNIEPPVNAPIILLVEDNDDLRLYMKNALTIEYKVVEANNGKMGLEVAYNEVPDLIISDVMMPEIDGMEMTKQLKNDPRTCHIPIILLTALTSPINETEGLNTGANDYLTKPFNDEILLLRVKNTLYYKQQMQQYLIKKYKLPSQNNFQPKYVEIPSADQKFIEHLLKVVEANISNTNFTTDQLATELAVARSLLYRKMNALINQTPNDFIIEMRLKRAAQLLKEQKFAIAEIALLVGFNDPVYFRKCFKKQFQKSPSEFAQNG